MAASEFVRVDRTTIGEQIKGEEVNIIRNQKILALMESGGRISFGHSGKRLEWDVRISRNDLTPYGDGVFRTWMYIYSGMPRLPEIIVEHSRLNFADPQSWPMLAFGVLYLAVLAGTLPNKPRVAWLIPIFWLTGCRPLTYPARARWFHPPASKCPFSPRETLSARSMLLWEKRP